MGPIVARHRFAWNVSRPEIYLASYDGRRGSMLYHQAAYIGVIGYFLLYAVGNLNGGENAVAHIGNAVGRERDYSFERPSSRGRSTNRPTRSPPVLQALCPDIHGP